MPHTDNHSLRTEPRRSFAGRIARWVFALILALVFIVGATLVAVFSFEQSTLGPLVETLVTRITGRALSIEGQLDARAGRIVSVRAGRIRLANADWGSSDDMLLIDGVEISVDLSSLLNGTPTIDNLVVTGGKILFEQDAQGRSNWTMGSHDDSAPPSDDPTPPSDAGAGALPLLIARSELSNIDIQVQSPALTRSLDIRLDSLEHSADQGNDLSVAVIGAVDNRPVNLQARIGPLTQLLAYGEVDFELKTDFDAFSIDAHGHLDNLLAPQQSTVQIAVVSPDAAQISSMFALPEIVTGPVELVASLLPSSDFHTLDVAGSIGDLDLDAQARLQALDTFDGSAIKLTVEGPDLAVAAKLAGLNGLPSKPFKFQSSVELSGKLLEISQTHFDTADSHFTVSGAMSQFPKLEGTNLNLELNGENYLEFAELLGLTELSQLKPAPFEVRGDLMYSGQDKQTFTAQVALGAIEGEFLGQLTEYPEFTGSQLDYLLSGPDSTVILRILDRPTLIKQSYKLQGKVERTDSGFSIERAALSLGANKLDISGVIGNDVLHGNTELALRYRGPDLDKIAGIAGYQGFMPAGDAEISTNVRALANGIDIGDFSVQLGLTTLKASGLVSLKTDLAGSRVKFSVTGEDIADVLPPELLAYVDAQQSFDLAGELETSSEQLAVSALTARLGEIQLEASGTVSMKHPLTDTSIAVIAHGPNLAAVIPEQLVPLELPAVEFSVAGGVALDEHGLVLDNVKTSIGPDRLELSGVIPLGKPVDGLDLTIAAKGPDLDAFVPIEFDQFDIKDTPYEMGGNLKLVSGTLSVGQLNFSTPRGSLKGNLSVSLEDPRKFGRFDLTASGDNFDEFVPAQLEYRPAAVPFDLKTSGSWDTKEVHIESGILELDNSRIEVQGEVDLPPNMTATRLVLSASGDSLADLGQVPGLVLPPDDFHVDITLHGDNNALTIPELDMHIGNSDLRGAFAIEFGDKPSIKINLSAKLLDLAQLLPPDAALEEVKPPTKPPAIDGRLIPRLPVPADQLNKINLVTSINIGELRLPNHTLQNSEIDLSLLNGDLTVRQFKATTAGGELIAQFRAVADGNRITTSGTLEGIDIVIGKEQQSEGGALLPEQNFHLTFETSGTTSRELAANLNGYLQLTGGTGRLQNSFALGLFGSFFRELLTAINPFVRHEPYTTITCFAVYAEIANGVAKINPGAVLQTDKLDVFARGEVDLKTEQIGLRFDTAAREGLGISVADFVNPFVGVGGTLANPGLGLDPQNAMFEGGVAVATGGLSIVAKSLFGRWFGTKDPCDKFKNQAEKLIKSREADS
jgi:uncharacterized protein involved in outer membrane biogenesis